MDAALAALRAAEAALTAPGAPFELVPRTPDDPVLVFRDRRENLRSLLVDAAAVERDCVVLDDGRRLTIGEFERAVAAIRLVLRRDFAIGPGDRVAIAGANSIEEHPAVAEAAVFGVADGTYGQVVHAAVVLREASDASEEELRAHCAETLSGYKVPVRIHVRREPLPRNPAGKVMKHVLTGEAESGFAEA